MEWSSLFADGDSLARERTQPKPSRTSKKRWFGRARAFPCEFATWGKYNSDREFRRGAIDLNGSEAVGGIVVMRFGENPRDVIQGVKEKLRQIEPSLGGVKVRGVYDRTGLVDETIGTLTTALTQQVLITAVVILLFLLHVRASFVVAVTLPVAVLLAFVGMNHFGIDANIMSLAGIAIAIGTMVDMGIIVSETIYDRLAEWGVRRSPRRQTPAV